MGHRVAHDPDPVAPVTDSPADSRGRSFLISGDDLKKMSGDDGILSVRTLELLFLSGELMLFLANW